jgi:hypothetical protein
MIYGSLLTFYLGWAAVSPPATADPYAHAIEVKRFSFESDEDKDYDGHPDDWSRRRGAGFPHYVRASIDRKLGYDGKQSLRYELNGAKVAFYSPLLRIDHEYGYVLTGRILTEGMQNDAAMISVSLLDHTRRRVRRMLSRPVTGTHRNWVEVQIGPFRPEPGVHFLVVGCHLAQGSQTDVRGNVWFDDLWLRSLPNLELSTISGTHFYKPGEDVQIVCRPSGIADGYAHRLSLVLENNLGNVIATHSVDFRKRDEEESDAPMRVQWTAPPREVGFYRVRGYLERDGIRVLERETSFLIMEPVAAAANGEFGWSASSGPGDMRLVDLADAAYHAGANWLKLPLWSALHSEHQSQFSMAEMSVFLDQLEMRNIRLVGLLSDPPATMTDKFASHWVGVSKVFTLPRESWLPSLEPLIARHAFRIRHWQLGGETDDSFIGLQTLPEVAASVKNEFDRIGHDSRIGYHWRWGSEFPQGDAARHSFLSLNGRERLSADELTERLRQPRTPGLERWVLLQPLPRSEVSVNDRAGELARQMLAAKLGKADAVFIADPLDRQSGLVTSDGSPTELFLPWRTMAMALRGAQYAGRLDLPQRSSNAVFVRQNEVTLALWNDAAGSEQLYCGEKAYQSDLWGRRQALTTDEATGLQSVKVGPAPLLIQGCPEALLKWMLAVQFEKGRIPSEFGAHEDALVGVNSFPQGISAKATLHMPAEWQADPGQWVWQSAAGEKWRLPTLLTFPNRAPLGRFRVKIDFEIIADRTYRFAVHRDYQLGIGDVDMQVVGRRLPDGRLELEQTITNTTDPVEVLDFNCSLYIPGQVRQRRVVTRLGRGEDKRVFHIRNPEQFRGQSFWLRAEQVDGRRVLNYHYQIGE